MLERYILRAGPILGPDPVFDSDKECSSGAGSGPLSAQGLSLFRRGQPAGSPSPEATPAADTPRVGDLREVFAQPLPPAWLGVTDPWDELAEIPPDSDVLARNNLFPNPSENPAVAAFDTLRTRLLQGVADRGWSRIAITSPMHGCGKSFVALNLAFSLARRAQSRTVLVDLDLRRPAIAGLLGMQNGGGLTKARWPGGRLRKTKTGKRDVVPPLADFLQGGQAMSPYFRRFGQTLALGLNGCGVPAASDLLHHPGVAPSLSAMQLQLGSEVVLYDMPPALVCDDVTTMAGQVDAVLLVTDGARSSAADIRACIRLFEGRLPLLGVVLNRAQDRRLARYHYGSGA